MVNERDRSQSTPKAGKHKRIRWLPLLLGVAVVLVSGSVVADVVLTYVANTGVAANATSPFAWAEGSNYATAAGFGFATTSFPGGGTFGPSMTTTLAGVEDVNVELVNINTFTLASTLPSGDTAVLGGMLTSGAPTTVANVVCAYAIITAYVPATSGTSVSGAPAGCGAFVPTSTGTVGAGCTGTPYAVVNLLTGAIGTDTIGGACSLTSSTSAPATILYVSFAIYTDGTVSGASMASFSVPVAIS